MVSSSYNVYYVITAKNDDIVFHREKNDGGSSSNLKCWWPVKQQFGASCNGDASGATDLVDGLQTCRNNLLAQNIVQIWLVSLWFFFPDA